MHKILNKCTIVICKLHRECSKRFTKIYCDERLNKFTLNYARKFAGGQSYHFSTDYFNAIIIIIVV